MADISWIELKVGYKKGGFSWTILQFLFQPAFVMTINQAQWQTFWSKMGVYLQKDAFSHGQLYVALSSVADPSNIKDGILYEGKTKNIVMKNVLV